MFLCVALASWHKAGKAINFIHPSYPSSQLPQCDRLTHCTLTTKQHVELQIKPTCNCCTNVIRSEPDSWGKDSARLLQTLTQAGLMGKCANRAALSKREVFCIACQTHWRWWGGAYCITPRVNISRALLQYIREMLPCNKEHRRLFIFLIFWC